MRRIEIIEGVKAISKALKESQMIEALTDLRRRPASARKDLPKNKLLNALRDYAIAAHN